MCRVAFYGKIDFTIPVLNRIKVKQGVVDRVTDKYGVIVKDLFKKETDLKNYL